MSTCPILGFCDPGKVLTGRLDFHSKLGFSIRLLRKPRLATLSLCKFRLPGDGKAGISLNAL